MNMKKILAAVSASVLAVSAMSVAASAAWDSTYTYSTKADRINITPGADEDPNRFFAQIQVGHVGEIAVTAKYTTADGATGYCTIGENWGAGTNEANAFKVTGAWNGAGIGLPDDVVEAAAGDFSGITIDFTFDVTDINADVDKQVADWGDDAAYEIKIAVVGINTVADDVMINGSLDAAPTETPDETSTETPTESTTTTGTDEANKTNTDTGVEGVAAVLGVAVVAAGAMVVAKKRK